MQIARIRIMALSRWDAGDDDGGGGDDGDGEIAELTSLAALSRLQTTRLAGRLVRSEFEKRINISGLS